MHGNLAVIGMQCFSLALRREKGGGFLLSGMASGDGGDFTDFWNPRNLPVDPSAALAVLSSAWPCIAGPFHPHGNTIGSFDISSLVGRSGEAVIDRDGVESIIKCGGRSIPLEVHSVVAVEVLMRLGNLLSSEANEADRQAWKAASADTELFPFPALSEDMESEPGIAEEELAWHAARLGINPVEFRQAGVWLYARQILFATKGEGTEVPASEWKAFSNLRGMPGSDEVDALSARAAKAYGKNVSTFEIEAITLRNSDARQVNVYRKWYPESSGATTPRT